MKTTDVIIGANFGDEGKGLVTDFRSASFGSDALVVRFNGGAQAGHTVVCPQGRRHVFSHFGSGSFAGAETFLSRFFICNPLLFVREYALLAEKSCAPVVHVDVNSPVTTPYDMMINQIAEDMRGQNRHGSCGVGFGETLERGEKTSHLTYADLADKGALRQKLEAIRRYWLPQRLAVLGIKDMPEEWKARVYAEGVVQKYLHDTEFFLQHSKAADGGFLSGTGKKIVFEGAQGLLLDQHRGFFPHVTRSNTGIKNALALAEEARLGALRITYITRAYMTRHGAGPLAHEMQQPPYQQIRDETNVKNAYQGHLRFGWLDVDFLARTIGNDLSDNRSSLDVTHGLAVTCLDQVDDWVSFVEDGAIKTEEQEKFLQVLKVKTAAGFLIQSRGASRGDVSPVLCKAVA